VERATFGEWPLSGHDPRTTSPTDHLFLRARAMISPHWALNGGSLRTGISTKDAKWRYLPSLICRLGLGCGRPRPFTDRHKEIFLSSRSRRCRLTTGHPMMPPRLSKISVARNPTIALSGSTGHGNGPVATACQTAPAQIPDQYFVVICRWFLGWSTPPHRS